VWSVEKGRGGSSTKGGDERKAEGAVLGLSVAAGGLQDIESFGLCCFVFVFVAMRGLLVQNQW
jgi:hypothetical protein